MSESSVRANSHGRKEKRIKKTHSTGVNELRSEYNLRELLKGGTRGKYARQFQQGTNLILLDPDVAKAFPTDRAVNEALELILELSRIPQTKKRTTRA